MFTERRVSKGDLYFGETRETYISIWMKYTCWNNAEKTSYIMMNISPAV